MIDLHSHILPGIDDGATTLADSVQIARDAVAAGVETLVATPHVRADYPNDAETIHRAVAATRGELDASGIALELLPGAELDLDYHATLDEEELARLGLGGNPRLLLIEFPYTGWPVALAETLAGLRLRGVTAVLAHPERNPEVQAGPARLQPLTEAGTLVQLTAGSVVGSLASPPRQRRTRCSTSGWRTSSRATSIRCATVCLPTSCSPRWITTRRSCGG